jgi:hypothetical protein
MKNKIITAIIVLTIALVGTPQVNAGTLYPTSEPGETMYSLQEIYNLVTASTTSAIGNGSPINTPSTVNGSMVTLTQLYNAILTHTHVINEDPQDPRTEPSLLIVHQESIQITENIIDDLDTTGEFNFTFDVEASGEDFYIPENGFEFMVQGATTSVTSSSILSSTADENTDGILMVNEGDTETFTLSVTVSDVGTSGQYRVILNSINVSPYSDGATNLETLNLQESLFASSYISLNQSETVPPIEPEDLTDHSNISSVFRQSMSSGPDDNQTGRFHFQFEVSAIDKDLYIKKDVDIAHVLVGATPLTSQVTSAETSLVHLASYDPDFILPTVEGPSVNGYFVVPAGTTKLFRQKVSVNNAGGTAKTIKLGLDALEYKVGSDSAGLRTLDLNQNEYQTDLLTFTNPII